MRLKHDVLAGNKSTFWGWILWYIPVLLLVVAWGYREFFYKGKKKCSEKKEQETQTTE
jgi:cytochrome c-type biogenesis protein CcmH/NrfF